MRARFLWRAYRARWRDQKAELAIIRANIRPGDLICDIGAHKGSYLFWLSRWAGHGRVVAFEPQSSLAAYLRSAMLRLKCTNVTVEAKGVSAVSGVQELLLPAKDSPGASFVKGANMPADCQRMMVPVVALDDYFQPGERVRLLKIDAEGAEMAIFRGARRVLQDSRPFLIFECEQRHLENGSLGDVFSFLSQMGYQGQFLAPEGLRPLQEFDPLVHQSQVGPRFWDADRYCNNFVFRMPS